MPLKPGFISPEQKEQILKSVDIVQLVSDYVVLKPSGKNFLGLCPFHQEKTPSFTVSPSYQNYKCYGCGESGDSIGFVMGIENLPFIEAIKFLARRGGIRLDFSKKGQKVFEEKPEIDNCLEQSLKFFCKSLVEANENSPIKDYLTKRQLNQEVVSSFQLGFVEAGWQNLNGYLNRISIDNAIQESAGLIKKGEKGGYYDRLRNRLIFPIKNKNGRLLGFAGRSIGNDDPKYLNPPETELYKKSEIFYGIDKAHQEIRRKRRAILVEGYLDVIRLHEFGWSESIATCGTAVTEQHIGLLKKYGAGEVILLFDGDEAGIKAAERSARLFIENNLDSKVVVLPKGLDPDDYFKKYTNQDFDSLIQKSSYDFEFVIKNTQLRFASKGSTYSENLIQEVVNLAEKIQSTIKKDLFFAKAAEIFKVERHKLQTLSFKSEKAKSDSNALQEFINPNRFNKDYIHEVRFLQYLMNHVQSIEFAREKVTPEDFINPRLSDVYARFLQLNNEEFKTLNATNFPQQFIEINEILMTLLQFESEYRGPSQTRPSSEDVEKLKLKNQNSLKTFSEASLILLIERLKKKKRSYEIKKLKLLPSEMEKGMVQNLADSRKQTVQIKTTK